MGSGGSRTAPLAPTAPGTEHHRTARKGTEHAPHGLPRALPRAFLPQQLLLLLHVWVASGLRHRPGVPRGPGAPAVCPQGAQCFLGRRPGPHPHPPRFTSPFGGRLRFVLGPGCCFQPVAAEEREKTPSIQEALSKWQGPGGAGGPGHPLAVHSPGACSGPPPRSPWAPCSWPWPPGQSLGRTRAWLWPLEPPSSAP